MSLQCGTLVFLARQKRTALQPQSDGRFSDMIMRWVGTAYRLRHAFGKKSCRMETNQKSALRAHFPQPYCVTPRVLTSHRVANGVTRVLIERQKALCLALSQHLLEVQPLLESDHSHLCASGCSLPVATDRDVVKQPRHLWVNDDEDSL